MPIAPRRLVAALAVALSLVTLGIALPNAPAHAAAPTTFPVGASPTVVALLPGGGTAWVATATSVVSVDTTTGATTVVFAGSVTALAFSPDGATAYLGVAGAQPTIATVDVASGAPTSTRPVVEAPSDLVVTADGARLWASYADDEAIESVPLGQSGGTTFLYNVSPARPVALAIGQGGTVSAADRRSGSLVVIRNGPPVLRGAAAQAPQNDVAAGSAGTAWVAAGDLATGAAGALYGIDTTTTPPSNGAASGVAGPVSSVALTPDRTTIAIAVPVTGEVLTFAADGSAAGTTFAFGAGSNPVSVAIDPTGVVGVVALQGSGAIGVFDPRSAPSAPAPAPVAPAPGAATPAAAPRLAESGMADAAPWALAGAGALALGLALVRRGRGSDGRGSRGQRPIDSM